MKSKRKIQALAVAFIVAASVAVAPSAAQAYTFSVHAGTKNCTSAGAPKYYISGRTKGDTNWRIANNAGSGEQNYVFTNISFTSRFFTAGYRHAQGVIDYHTASQIHNYGSSCDS